MTNTVKKQIQKIYKSGIRQFPAIMSIMKKADTPVTMKEIGEALKEIRTVPVKKKTTKRRKKVAKKKVSKKKGRKKTAKKSAKKAAKKGGKKRGPGRPKGSKNKKKKKAKKATRRGRKAGAGRKATGYLISTPKGRGVSSTSVSGKPALERALAKLVAKGVDPKKIQIYQKVSFQAEASWKIKV